MAWVGLISIVFLDDMYELWLESRSACDFMMRSMLADHPYSPVTRQHGESANLFDTTTFSTFVSRMSLICLHKPSVAAFASSNLFFSSSVSSRVIPSFVAQISFLSSNSFSCSMNGEFSTEDKDSPVT